MAQQESRIFVNKCYIYKFIFVHFVNNRVEQKVAFSWIDFRFEGSGEGACFGRIFIGMSAINHRRTQSIFVCKQKDQFNDEKLFSLDPQRL